MDAAGSFAALCRCNGSGEKPESVVKKPDLQEQAIAEIRTLGGSVSVDPQGAVSVNLADTQVTDAGLEHLKGLTGLKVLWLGGTHVTGSGLKFLKGLANLEWLDLERTRITDAGLEHLKGLTNLKWLYLEHTQVTDEGVRDLQRTLPNCDIQH
jgi:Leucine-rich repeat (LRR) protein